MFTQNVDELSLEITVSLHIIHMVVLDIVHLFFACESYATKWMPVAQKMYSCTFIDEQSTRLEAAACSRKALSVR